MTLVIEFPNGEGENRVEFPFASHPSAARERFLAIQRQLEQQGADVVEMSVVGNEEAYFEVVNEDGEEIIRFSLEH